MLFDFRTGIIGAFFMYNVAIHVQFFWILKNSRGNLSLEIDGRQAIVR